MEITKMFIARSRNESAEVKGSQRKSKQVNESQRRSTEVKGRQFDVHSVSSSLLSLVASLSLRASSLLPSPLLIVTNRFPARIWMDGANGVYACRVWTNPQVTDNWVNDMPPHKIKYAFTLLFFS